MRVWLHEARQFFLQQVKESVVGDGLKTHCQQCKKYNSSLMGGKFTVSNAETLSKYAKV